MILRRISFVKVHMNLTKEKVSLVYGSLKNVYLDVKRPVVYQPRTKN